MSATAIEVGAAFAVVVTTTAALLSRGGRSSYVPTPRQIRLAMPPSPCAAVGEVLSAGLDMPDAEVASQAFAKAFPGCVEQTQKCMEGMITIKGCLQALRPEIPPVQKQELPNTCDPLVEPPTGTVCVPAGNAYVLRPSQVEAEVPFLDAVETGEVRVSSDYESVRIGSFWPIQTLDTWLEQRRQAGEFPTKSTYQLPIDYGLPAYQWHVLDWPGAESAYDAVSFGDMLLSAAAAAAIRDFAETHFVLTPNGTVRIIDLPHTQAVHDFRNAIVAYVAQFQKRTF